MKSSLKLDCQTWQDVLVSSQDRKLPIPRHRVLNPDWDGSIVEVIASNGAPQIARLDLEREQSGCWVAQRVRHWDWVVWKIAIRFEFPFAQTIVSLILTLIYDFCLKMEVRGKTLFFFFVVRVIYLKARRWTYFLALLGYDPEVHLTYDWQGSDRSVGVNVNRNRSSSVHCDGQSYCGPNSVHWLVCNDGQVLNRSLAVQGRLRWSHLAQVERSRSWRQQRSCLQWWNNTPINDSR